MVMLGDEVCLDLFCYSLVSGAANLMEFSCRRRKGARRLLRYPRIRRFPSLVGWLREPDGCGHLSGVEHTEVSR